MSYMFGLGKGKVSKKTFKKASKFASEWDAYMVCYDDPADGPCYWFAGPNHGSPFDRAMSQGVAAALQDVGMGIHNLGKRKGA